MQLFSLHYFIRKKNFLQMKNLQKTFLQKVFCKDYLQKTFAQTQNLQNLFTKFYLQIFALFALFSLHYFT